MASEDVNNYIKERYDRWLDYSTYHCSHAGMIGEEVDVLNEVLYMLLKKDVTILDDLLSRKKDSYTELDFYVLRMIKLNITSDTSPYRNKYKAIPRDEDADFQTMEIVDEEYYEDDKCGEILNKYEKVREILESLQLSEFAHKVFFFRFFEDESFSDWPGNEDKKTLYETYKKVAEMIKERLFNNSLF